jgi:hypothetical protein
MLTRAAKRGRILIFTIGVLIGSGLSSPMTADAVCRSKWCRKQAKAVRCQPPKSLVRTDTKMCPPTKFRPTIKVYRSCCENRGGKRQCHPFPVCPAHSPS